MMLISGLGFCAGLLGRQRGHTSYSGTNICVLVNVEDAICVPSLLDRSLLAREKEGD